jgi:hypothetical protein
MFSNRCLIQITQMSPQQRWLRVSLHAPRFIERLGEGFGWVGDQVPGYEWAWRYLEAQGEAFAWWGRYNVDLNSFNNYNYNITNEHTIWVYFQQHLRADFVGGSASTSGDPQVSRVVTLRGAWLSTQGIDPIDYSGTSASTGRRFGPALGAQGIGDCFLGANSAFFVPGERSLIWTHDETLRSR